METFLRRPKPRQIFTLSACTVFLSLIANVFVANVSASESRQAYVITLQNQPPETLIPVVQPLLAEGDGITGFGNELIITTDAQRIENIRSIVQKIDTPLHNLLISVRNNNSGDEQNQQQGFSGGIKQDKIYVGTGTPVTPPSNGAIISSDGLAYSTSSSKRTFSTRSEQQLRAIEGQPAFLYTGQNIKLPSQNAYGNPYTIEADALQGVYVRARLNGDRVQLNISTSNDSLKSSTNRQVVIDTQHLSTTVSGRIGEWINLAGISLSDDNQGNNQVKKTTTSSNSIGNISVKITPVD